MVFNLIVFFLLLAAPAAVIQAQIYVSPSGNDTTGTGSIDLPFRTITQAVSVAVAGDTIYLRGGRHYYSAKVSISKVGSSGSKYYLFAYSGERPILDFSAMAVNSSNRGISLSGQYWHVKGLDIYKAGDNGMHVSGSNNIIEFCSFYENYDTGLQLGNGASNNQVINCDSYFNADPSNGNADGFAPKLDVGSGNYFYGCRAWQNSDDGYDGYLRPSNNITTTYENCWCFMNGYLKSGGASSGNGNGFKMGGSDDKTLMHNVIMKNCLSFDNRVKGFDQNNNKGSMTLYNCTAYRNGTNYGMPGPIDTVSGKVMTLVNCVVLGSEGSIMVTAVQQTNSWMDPPFTTVTVADFESIDTAGVRGPRMPDGSLPDITFMHLASGSQLVDAGTDVGLPYYGSAPDLGAFESIPPVPVELVSFDYRVENSIVILSWKTVTEVNCYGFEVQRRIVAEQKSIFGNWTKVGFMAGAGNSNAPKEYVLAERNLHSGRYAYRIKQIDQDGTFKYSQTLEVEFSIGLKSLTLEQNYPNPFNPATTIHFTLPDIGITQDVSLVVYDVLGRRVEELINEKKSSGTYTITWDASKFPSGVYFYRLKWGEYTQSKRMLFVK